MPITERSNTVARERLANDGSAGSAALGSELRALAEQPIIDVEGHAVFARDEVNARGHLDHYAGDPVGLEVFANHQHLDDWTDAPVTFGDGVAVARELAERLAADPSGRLFTVIVGGDDPVVRFHRTQPDSTWLLEDDLDRYAEPILLIYTS